MPTRRGWQTLALGVGALVIGRVLGLVSLYVIGTAGVILPVTALLWVRSRSFHLEARRHLRPARVMAGTAAGVELRVRNRGSRASPVLVAADSLGEAGAEARLLLASLGPGEEATAAYQVPTERRGVIHLGPLRLELSDPFGLAVAGTQAAAGSTLLVLPRVDAVLPPPVGVGDSPDAGGTSASRRGQRGEDFYALRPYDRGDDLRRVHWNSTARVGELMVRQDDRPHQDRVTVLVDQGVADDDGVGLDRAVSAAASVVAAATATGRSQVRLVDTAGTDTGYGTGVAHRDRLLDHLARLAPGSGADPARVVAGLGHTPGGGTLVAVTPEGEGRGLDALAGLRPRFSPLLLVVVDAAEGAPGTATAPGRSAAGGVQIVRTGPDAPFPRAWAAAVGGRAGRTGAPNPTAAGGDVPGGARP